MKYLCHVWPQAETCKLSHVWPQAETCKLSHMSIEVNDKALETDPEGFLVNWDEWSRDVAEAMAAADDLELTDNHWK